jgi:hypothetical protein
LQAEWSLIDHEKQKIAVQSELDDLLMVFGDLEEKVEKYEVRGVPGIMGYRMLTHP